MFGEWGGLVLQLTVTVAVILGLIAVVYWLVRRFSGDGLGRLNRGRVPRLAVIDATPIDGRRRLVLVRRDNVEHLILLGGPTDVVVEQAIQRPRQRPAARPQALGSTTETPAQIEPATPPPAENAPIPFPQSRVHQPTSHQTASPMERTYAPARRAAQAILAEPVTEPESDPHAAEAIAESPESTPADSPMYETRLPYPPRAPINGNGHIARMDFGVGGIQAPAASPFTPAPADSETAAKVNDLEREMARLLGEITAKRPS